MIFDGGVHYLDNLDTFTGVTDYTLQEYAVYIFCTVHAAIYCLLRVL